MPDHDEIQELATEIKELKNEVKELRMLVLYRLLREEERSIEGLDKIVPFAKQTLRRTLEKMLQPEMKDVDEAARKAKKPATTVKVTSKEESTQPLVDVDREIKILKTEMAKSLRNAAREIDEREENNDGDEKDK